MGEHNIRVALIDDNSDFLNQMSDYVKRAAKEEHVTAKIDLFADGSGFIKNYSMQYDMIFLDVEMPEMDGLATAKKIREVDETACLIFVTSIVKYAVNGYEVNALDFMVKPVEYFTLLDKFKKALQYQKVRREKYIQLFDEDKFLMKIAFSEIFYLEKERNYIVYHTQQGVFKERGTMAEKEDL